VCISAGLSRIERAPRASWMACSQQTHVAPSLAHREPRIFAGGVGREGRHVGHKSTMDRACRDPPLLAARLPTSHSPLKTAYPFGRLST